MKLKKGDQVKVLIGKDKGRIGEIITNLAKTNQVVIKGLNLFKKHVKATKTSSGGVVEKERPLKVSKVQLICPSCKKPTRVGYQLDKSQEKYRICKKCHSVIDQAKK